ncbi:MAG: hypothetical protein GKR89_13295 [Candidatus Latescibacteria bacterium]|nr:hypothetical protein [Candidatus Latescibacterota bacterium]
MHRWNLGFFIAALLIGLPYLQGEVQAQSDDEELEELLQEAEEEEQSLRQILDTGLPTPGEEARNGRFSLPSSERTERLRISQDREVDPDTYIVGPGDVFILYIWGELDIPYELVVDPEGHVHIPTIGLHYISQKTLAEAKQDLIAAAGAKYPGARITVTLSSLRFFTVFLTGAVQSKGSIIVHPVTRVSDLIERAGLVGLYETPSSDNQRSRRRRQSEPKKPAGERTIKLIHRDASVDTVDLAMFLATGDVRYNPYVRMGDILHADFQQAEIFAYGAVFSEGPWEHRADDTVGSLLILAGGLQPQALLEESEIWRSRADGLSPEVIPLANYAPSGRPVTLEDVRDIPLEAQDMLFIRSVPNWKETPTVSLYGAVKFSGRYRIVEGRTNLSEIILRAGGFTEKAALAKSRLIRSKYRAVKDPELIRLQELSKVSGLADMNPEDRAYLKTKGRQDRGRVAIDFQRLIGDVELTEENTVDFQRLFEEGDQNQDIALEGGDVIFIPERLGTVSLSGQLTNPGLIDFKPGLTVEYYLEQAGGFGFNANKDGARLIQARTGQRIPLDRKAGVLEGDEIWVPENEYRDWWEFTRDTMRTIAETLTLVVLVRSF